MPDGAGFQPRWNAAQAQLRVALARARRLQPKQWAIAAAVVVGLIVLALMTHWYTYSRFQVATDNAYVRADISNVSAQVEGHVVAVPAEENQSVRAGDVLVEIEAQDYETALARARAALAQAEGDLAARRAERAQAAAELARYRPLAQRGMFSPAGMDAIEARANAAEGSLAAAEAAVAAARADIAEAELDLDRTTIRAPIDGVVGDRQVRVGQLVRSGTPLMAVVPLRDVYVVANFKETQIANLRQGQPVRIQPDIDHDLELEGVVDSIAPASGTEFSIIPTDTATGNFTKIVQRVPVRIRIAPGQDAEDMLRAGLSVRVSVDTRR